MRLLKSRYALLTSFIAIFLTLSLGLRIVLICRSWTHAGIDGGSLAMIFVKGLVYDLTVALMISFMYAVYLMLLPAKWNNKVANRLITYAGLSVTLLLCMFSFFAEFTFWNEFESRFNFIAVDYLIYTYEVVSNINQSYPLPALIGGILATTLGIIFFLRFKKVFHYTFTGADSWSSRVRVLTPILALTTLLGVTVTNRWADHGNNRYINELSKAGIFSFFAAFRSNELNYDEFYTKSNTEYAFSLVRTALQEPNTIFAGDKFSIRRKVEDAAAIMKPNVIMVTIESLSADFMNHFGNKQSLTPVLDSLADKSILFSDMYATGTRTVRGMEALSLSIPPTPGNSIVRRKNNEQLNCIGSIFKNAGYSRTFFYGGDGYFDNMNAFFGNNGFDIVDRGSKVIPGEHFTGNRTSIPDSCVHFENAWGICDEDLYDAVIRDADKQYTQGIPFYDFVMTTSNHRPYTYPAKKIDIPSGTGREGAVKYTDYAIGQFLRKIKNKPWFKNTVFIFVADHCASSAGKNEINIEHYHIPCIIYHLSGLSPAVISTTCSQIDLYPTLFGLMNWSYTSTFYGNDVLSPIYEPRAFVGTYQQLGYLEHDTLVVLSPQRKSGCFKWERNNNEQIRLHADSALISKAVAYYESAYYLFTHNGLKE